MGEVCINNQIVEKIELIDTTKNNEVLATMFGNASQICENGYVFKITYREVIEKE